MPGAARLLALLALALAVASLTQPWWSITRTDDYGEGRIVTNGENVPAYFHSSDNDFVTAWGARLSALAVAAAALALLSFVSRAPGERPFGLSQSRMARAGDICLGLAVVGTLLVAVGASIESETTQVIQLALAALLPLLAALCWRLDLPVAAWACAALHLAVGIPYDGEEAGAIFLVAPLFALGNLAWRWPQWSPWAPAAALGLLSVAAACAFVWPDDGNWTPPFWGELTWESGGLSHVITGEPALGWWLAVAAAGVAALTWLIGRRERATVPDPTTGPPIARARPATEK